MSVEVHPLECHYRVFLLARILILRRCQGKSLQSNPSDYGGRCCFFVVPRLLRSSLIKSLSQISKKRDPHEHTICGSLSYTIGSRPAPRPAHRDLSCWLQDDRRLVATHQTSRLPVLRGYHPSYLSICRSPLFYSATSSSSPRSLVSLAFLPPHLLLLMNV